MSWGSDLSDRWKALAQREQRLLTLAAAVVGVALLWWLALAPALALLRSAPARHAALDAQLGQMRGLQAQAKALQEQPKMGADEALRALDLSVKERLGGGAQLIVAGDRATVTLRGVPADTLAQWLTQARVNARAVPAEARLVRSAATPPGKAGAAWDGSVVLTLPSR
jgi:general secretion pathway protein M